jgi:hypothetical protein
MNAPNLLLVIVIMITLGGELLEGKYCFSIRSLDK